MRRLSGHWSLEAKILSGFGVALAALLAVAVAQYRTIQTLVDVQRFEAHTIEVVAQLEGLSADLARVQSSVRLYVLTGAEQPAIPARIAHAREHLRALCKLATDHPLDLPELDQLQKLAGRRIAFLQHVETVGREQGPAAAIEAIRQAEGVGLLIESLDLTDQMVADERGRLALRSSATQRSATRTLRVTLLVDALAFSLLMVAAWIIHTDIQKRRQAEEASRMLASIVTSTDDAVIAARLDGTILTWNGGAERLYLHSADEAVGRPVSILIPPGGPNDLPEIFEKIGRGQTVRHYETVRTRKDGHAVPVSLTVSAIKDPEGRVIGASAITRDITERKRTDEALRQSLATKEVLLREVHHRVKNNLQIISSLLNMQADLLANQDARAAFDESQRRVRSMALIHDQLCNDPGSAELDFGEYATSLAGELMAAQGGPSGAVRLRLEADPVRLSVDQAMPCGLILNELLTNALKYAFPDGRAGEILVALHCSEGGRVALRVADDGVGLPAGFDWRHSESLGLRIVDILTRQLNGALVFPPGRGADFTLTFAKQ